MSGHDLWLAAVPAFAASLVECVEALTIVLAVGATAGWRPSLAGAALALLALVAAVIVLGPHLLAIPERPLKLVIGALLLAFGLRWLRKAILRAAGALALHDEGRAYARTREQVAARADSSTWSALGTSFAGVALEGLEVAFIVLALGRSPETLQAAGIGAGVAALAVTGLGIVLHRPLLGVPENALKMLVGIMLSGIGTFWFLEGVGVRWPSDAEILGPILLYALIAAATVAVLRRRTRAA